MVSAILSHKAIVLNGKFMTESSSLYFSGEKDIIRNLYQMTDYIEYEQILDVQIQLDRLAEKKAINYREYLACKEDIKRYKKEHLLWMFSKKHRNDISEMQSDCEALRADNNQISANISKLEDQRFVNFAEKTEMFKSMLRDLVFECKNSRMDEDGLQSDYYECMIPDDKLAVKVQDMLVQMQERHNVAMGERVQDVQEMDTMGIDVQLESEKE